MWAGVVVDKNCFGLHTSTELPTPRNHRHSRHPELCVVHEVFGFQQSCIQFSVHSSFSRFRMPPGFPYFEKRGRDEWLHRQEKMKTMKSSIGLRCSRFPNGSCCVFIGTLEWLIFVLFDADAFLWTMVGFVSTGTRKPASEGMRKR